MYVPNDHTPFAVRFSATGSELATNAVYYVKIRLSPTTSPGGTSNRGFTWNATSHTWTQERDAWTNFPSVTTDGSGHIASTWEFCKFGDTSLSGTYYLIISLSQGGSGGTYNGTIVPPVTVMDMTSNGFWVHNGIAYGTQTTRAEADNASDTTKIWALSRTELNGVDDDSDGTFDNEDYGPSGSAGDFRFGVPTGASFVVRLNKTTWGPSFSNTTPDVDIALRAADQSPPTAPGTLTATPGYRSVDLSWGAATDDTAVTAYNVYRWTDVAGGSPYTPVHTRFATVTSGTSFHDSGLTNGTTYHYEVRAVDAATNVGPRSNTANAAPLADTTPPTTTDDTDGLWHNTGVTVHLTATDTGSGMVGGLAKTEYSTDGGSSWDTGTSVPVTADPDGSNDGVHTILYRSTDAAGNQESPDKSCDVKIDTRAPMSADDSNGWAGVHTVITLTAADSPDGSGVAYTQYKVDDAMSWTTGTEVVLDAPPEGGLDGLTSTIIYRSIDNAGNLELFRSIVVTYDTVAPTLTGDNHDSLWHRSFPLTFSGSDDASGIDHYEYQVGSDPTWHVSDGDTVVFNTNRLGNPSGARDVTYRAVDRAGNVSTAAGSCTVLIDGKAPTTGFSVSAEDPAGPRDVTLTPGDAQSGVARTRYSTDYGLTWHTGTSFTLTDPGTYWIVYYSVDRLGITERRHYRTVTVLDSGGSSSATALRHASRVHRPAGR